MIRNLKLKNFKCFENLDLDLKNVNIFTGINGMGKSTVIQSLLLLEQSRKSGREEKGLYLDGKYIALEILRMLFMIRHRAIRLRFHILHLRGK